MAGRKHTPSGEERTLLLALAGAAQGVAESEAVRDALIRRARAAGAIYGDIARAAHLAKDTVRGIVKDEASGS